MKQPLEPLVLLDSFRDLGVSAGNDVDTTTRRLACDPSFNRYSAFWLEGPTVDATSAALEALRELEVDPGSPPDTPSECSLRQFLARHYALSRGRFNTSSHPRTEGLYAAHTAVGMLKGLVATPCSERLTGERFRLRLAVCLGVEESSYNPLAAIEDLVRDCSEGGGLIDNPDWPLIASLTSLYTANSLLWNLFEDRSVTYYQDRSAVHGFVRDCLKQQEVSDRRIAGFVIHPDVSELCVNTTFFGLKLMNDLGIPLDLEPRREIENFLLLAYEGGGFCSTLWEPSSLNATFFGLRALKLLWRDGNGAPVSGDDRFGVFCRHEREAIRDFVLGMFREEPGGFPFSDHGGNFRRNAVATRYALQVVAMVGIDLRGEPWGADVAFYLNSLFDPATGGFRAYEGAAVDVSGLDRALPTWLNEYLGAKDERLFAADLHHPEANRSNNPFAGFEAEASSLYRELDALLPALPTRNDKSEARARVEAIQLRFEQLDLEEARCLEALLEAELAPLEGALKRYERSPAVRVT